jgi:Uncharacterized protein conserved in bacteria (DUF2188)
MSEITVFRHGDRWAVQDDPSTAPTAEYGTREEAEMAARQIAGDREVVVREDTGGGERVPDAPEGKPDPGAGIDARQGEGVLETPRVEQGGL